MTQNSLYTMLQKALILFLSLSILVFMLWKNAEASTLGAMLLTQDAQKHTQDTSAHIMCIDICLIPHPMPNGKTQSGYLDDLNAEGVIVGVAALVKGKTKCLLPVNRDTVEVLVC